MITEEQHQQWKKDLEELFEVKVENKRLRKALIDHRRDLHCSSKRPCETCRNSAKALGIKVPDQCAREDWDEKALKEKTDERRSNWAG